jgi:hypothetical protein
MNLLLDTHALLWLFDDDARLSENAKEIIANPDNQCFQNVGAVGYPQFTDLSVSRVNTIIGNANFCISDNLKNRSDNKSSQISCTQRVSAVFSKG